MKLPGVPTRRVESAAGSTLDLGETVSRTISTVSKEMSEGLAAYGQELTKTQRMRAEAKFAGGLADVRKSLDKPYLSIGEIKEALGESGLEALSPQARSFITDKRQDTDIVPTWVVGEEVFAAKAKKVKEEASQEVGWRPTEQRDFNFAADRELLARRTELSGKYMREQHNYQVASQTGSILAFVDAARSPVEFDRARSMINSSNVLEPEAKEKLIAKVQEAQDTTPIYDALRSQSIVDMEIQLGQVNDLKQKPGLDAKERETYAEALRHAIDRTRRAAQPPDPKKVMEANAERIWATLTGVWEQTAKAKGGWTQQEANALYGSVVPHTSKTVGSSEWRQMQTFIHEHTLKAGTGKAKKDPQAGLDELVLADTVRRWAHEHPEQFKDGQLWDAPGGALKLTDLVGKLSNNDFEEMSKLQFTLKQKGAGDPKYKAFTVENDIVDSIARRYGIDPSDKAQAPTVKKIREVARLGIQEKAPDGNLSYEEKEKAASAAVGVQAKAHPTWFGLSSETTLPLINLDVDPHVAHGFGKLVASGVLSMDQAEKQAPLYAADEGSILSALDAAGLTKVPTTASIDLWGWAQLHKVAIDERVKAKGREGDAVAWWMVALDMRRKPE